MSLIKLPCATNGKIQSRRGMPRGCKDFHTHILSRPKRMNFLSSPGSEKAMKASFPSLIYIRLLPKSSPSSGIQEDNAIRRLPSFRVQQQGGALALAVSCVARDSDDELSKEGGSEDGLPTARSNGGLLKIASIIGVSTAASKVLGLVRETALAAAFGVGPVMTAFNYASILPSFFRSLLGGLNGPLHTTVTTALSKRSKESGRQLIEKTTAIAFLVTAALGAVVFVFADSIIDATAPGLWATGVKHSQLTRDIAIIQLKIMTPCVVLAGPIGIGFGCLNAVGIYGFPSLSPAISSVAILLAVGVYCLRFGTTACVQTYLAGGVLIACGASIGTLAQWLMQIIVQQGAGFGVLSICWTNPLTDTDIHEFSAVMIPAMVGSVMHQIATFTDLYFASFISGAAASLSYVLGSPFYMIRDLLVRVFYVLEDAQSPFQITVAAVIMNAFLDWILILKMRLGAEGLVIGTSLVTALSTIALLLMLSRKLGGLALTDWVRPCFLLVAYCIFSMVSIALFYTRLQLLFPSVSPARSIWVSELLLIVLASSIGVLTFFFPLFCFRSQELESMKKFMYVT